MMVTGTGHLCLRRAVALRLASGTTSTSVTSNVKYRMGSTRYLGTCGSYSPPYIYFRIQPDLQTLSGLPAAAGAAVCAPRIQTESRHDYASRHRTACCLTLHSGRKRRSLVQRHQIPAPAHL